MYAVWLRNRNHSEHLGTTPLPPLQKYCTIHELSLWQGRRRIYVALHSNQTLIAGQIKLAKRLGHAGLWNCLRHQPLKPQKKTHLWLKSMWHPLVALSESSEKSPSAQGRPHIHCVKPNKAAVSFILSTWLWSDLLYLVSLSAFRVPMSTPMLQGSTRMGDLNTSLVTPTTTLLLTRQKGYLSFPSEFGLQFLPWVKESESRRTKRRKRLRVCVTAMMYKLSKVTLMWLLEMEPPAPKPALKIAVQSAGDLWSILLKVSEWNKF